MESLTLFSFIIAGITGVFAALFFMFGKEDSKSLRYGIGAMAILFTVVFVLIGIISFMGGLQLPSVSQRAQDLNSQGSSEVENEDFFVPRNAAEASAKWGGESHWWTIVDDGGWKVNGSLSINVDEGWRIDYVDRGGNIRSCDDIYEPGDYGPTRVEVTVATLWYVPGETVCPEWTTWAKSRQ